MTRRIAWVAGFSIAVTVALLMRGLGSDWLTTVSAALTFLVLPDMLARRSSNAGASTRKRSQQLDPQKAGEISARYP
jgi:hypothetical protein